VFNLPDVNWYAWLSKESFLKLDSNLDLYNVNTTTNVSTPVPRFNNAIQNVKVAWPVALSPKGNMLLTGCIKFTRTSSVGVHSPGQRFCDTLDNLGDVYSCVA